ncbi:hypothetical protein CAEBREN_07195 [Caenorhabditis brenneri]|uniref:Uncharacterized protein n=1 Tax=Caenorhabditis brenneri TaxID=135651 RepID=G0MCM6_CAEBE|nr:hypothetical protein CAEBREN_07195 [Caenorhabditis brenneri]
MNHSDNDRERRGERHEERRRRRRDRRERVRAFEARYFRRHNRDEHEESQRSGGDRGGDVVLGAIARRQNYLALQKLHNAALAEAEAVTDEKLKELEEKREEYQRQMEELVSECEILKELKMEKEKTAKMEIEMEKAVQKLCKLKLEEAQKQAIELEVSMKQKDEEAAAKVAYHKMKLDRLEDSKNFEKAKSEALVRGMAGEHFVRATARFRELEEEEQAKWAQRSGAFANLGFPFIVDPMIAPPVGIAQPTVPSTSARFRELEDEERAMWIQRSEAIAKYRFPAAVNPFALQLGLAEPTVSSNSALPMWVLGSEAIANFHFPATVNPPALQIRLAEPMIPFYSACLAPQPSNSGSFLPKIIVTVD